MRSSARSCGRSRRDIGDDLDAGLARPQGDQGDAAIDQVFDLDDALVQVDLAGFGLRQVEDVVDQIEQVGAAALDVAQVFTIALAADRAVHLLDDHVGETDDGIQGRAQLVAHRGQELRLGPVGALGVVLGAQQFRFGRLAVGDVEDDAIEKHRPAVVAEDAAAALLHPAQAAVLAADAVFDDEGIAARGRGEDDRVADRPILRIDQVAIARCPAFAELGELCSRRSRPWPRS